MHLNLTDFSHIFQEKPLPVICNCIELSKTAFLSGITKKTWPDGSHLENLGLFSFQADLSTWCRGGWLLPAARRWLSALPKCWRSSTLAGTTCRGDGTSVASAAWNQDHHLTSGEHLNDFCNANCPALTLSTPRGLFCFMLFIDAVQCWTGSFLQFFFICVGIYVPLILWRSLQATARCHKKMH